MTSSTSLHHTFNHLFPQWAKLRQIARESQTELYVVGGSVRDALLHRPLADMDMVCQARNMEYWEKHIAQLSGGHFFTLGKEGLITRRLVSGSFSFDLTPLEGDDIAADLQRRDFTINAIALGLHDDSFHDPHYGLEALKQRQLLCVSPTSLQSDPLRILRAVRFALTLDMQLPTATTELMAAARPGLTDIAGERIGNELSLILTHPHAAAGIRRLADTKALDTMFPPLHPLRGLSQNEYHHVDVFEHTLQMFECLDDLLADPPPHAITSPDNEQTVILRLAALFHDAGKALAKTVDPQTGKVHFYGHEQISAHLADTALRPLGLGKQTIARINRLIEHHLAPLLLSLGRPKAKAFRKLVFALEEDLPLLVVLALADNLAARGKNFSQRQEKLEACARELLSVYRQERKSFLKPLLSGKDLLALGMEPGPQMGVIIRAVHQRQINGECTSREEALAWVRNLLSPTAPGGNHPA
jgi:poly(A) polymerase